MLNSEIKIDEEIETEMLNLIKINCEPGVLCVPESEFEMIEKCAICGKLI
jgi:hypothetical protein